MKKISQQHKNEIQRRRKEERKKRLLFKAKTKRRYATGRNIRRAEALKKEQEKQKELESDSD